MSYSCLVVCKTSPEIKGEYCSNKEDFTCPYHIKLFPDSVKFQSLETLEKLWWAWKIQKRGAPAVLRPHVFASPGSVISHRAAPAASPCFVLWRSWKEVGIFLIMTTRFREGGEQRWGAIGELMLGYCNGSDDYFPLKDELKLHSWKLEEGCGGIALKARGDLVTECECKAEQWCSLHGSISELYSNILKCNIDSNFSVLTHQVSFTINTNTIQSPKELRLIVILSLPNQRQKCNLHSLPKYTPSVREQKDFDFRQAKSRKYRDYRRNMIFTSSYIWIMATFNCQCLKTLKLCGHVHRKAFHDWLHYQSIQSTKGLLNLSKATSVHRGE